MQTLDWTKIAHYLRPDVELLHAYYVQHAYPRHSHDYYVISLIERGHQSFTHQGTKHRTPPGGLILINPGAVHTGEAADTQGFELRALYPSLSLMETATYELTGRRALPFFYCQFHLIAFPGIYSHFTNRDNLEEGVKEILDWIYLSVHVRSLAPPGYSFWDLLISQIRAQLFQA